VVAGFLNSLINHADVVKIANLAQLVNVIAPIFTNDKGLFLQTIYYPLQLFSTHVKGNSWNCWWTARPTRASASTRSPISTPRARWMAAIWWSMSSIAISIRRWSGHRTGRQDFSGAVAVSEVNGPDIKARMISARRWSAPGAAASMPVATA